MGRNVVAVFLVVLFILAVLDDHSGQCMPTQRTQTEASCEATCTYLEAYRQADCEDRKLSEVPTECNAASYLSLRHNQIERIEPGTFESFSELQVLILSNNRIRRVGENAFHHLKRLKRLDLSFNKLKALPGGLLKDLISLTYLDLSANALTVLAPEVFTHLSQLQPACAKISCTGRSFLWAADAEAALVECAENMLVSIPASVITVLIHRDKVWVETL
ncbi:uncharacterized protein [Diadema antillarum]|uniref:uncharacterized protein n=1 Tax=Diadema antillarum TaxID=105358 RepID=UPI003A8B2246